MTRTRIAQAWLFTAVLAAMAAPSARLGAAPIGGEGPSIKSVVCGGLGCPGGDRNCAEVVGKVADPLIGEISVKFYCGESRPLEM